MRIRLALLLAGLRWRAGASLAMLAVAVAAVSIGAFGPIYLHSAQQSILDSTLAGAPTGTTGLTVEPAAGTSAPAATLRHVADAAPRPPGGGRWFGAPIETVQTGLTPMVAGQPYASDLVARTGVCRHLVFVSGRCPGTEGPGTENSATDDTVALSTRSAALLGVHVGQRVTATASRSTRATALRVVGLYRAGSPEAPYWWGDDFFPFGQGKSSRPRLDDVFTTPSTVTAAPGYSRTLQLPLVPRSLESGDVPALEASLRSYRSSALRTRSVQVGTQLPRVLDQSSAIESTVRTIVVVIDLQLTLLALFALFFVSTRTAAERAPDLRLADLRGFRPRTSLAVALAEPVAVIVLAIPAGLLLAWALAAAVGTRLFLGGIGASLSLTALAAAVATGLVGIAATALGAQRLLASAAEGGTGVGTAPRPPSTWQIVAEATAVAVAAAAFIELWVSGVSVGSASAASSHTDLLAAFAPGLLALGVGVVGARLLPLLVGATLGLTSNTRRVATALATRRVGRSREFAPQIVLMVIAVGLGTFGVAGWAIAAGNRATRSRFEVGASRVLDVDVRPGVDFLAATRAAGGGGRSAMAAVVEHASDGTTLAVDTSRLVPVASWPAGLSPGGAAVAARRLVPRGLAPPVTVSGRALAVTIDSAGLARPPPELSVDLFDNGFQTAQQVMLGPLVPGPATYRGSLSGLCPSGCRLVDLALTWNPPGGTSPSGTVADTTTDLLVSSLAQRTSSGRWVPVAGGLRDARRWRTPSGGARLAASARGLHVRARVSADGIPTTVAPADTPTRLPVILTTASAALDQGPGTTVAVVGLDGDTINGRQVGQVAALPGLGQAGALVDLTLAQHFLSGPSTDVTSQVWLAPDAPASIVARLRARGVTVVRTETASGRATQLAHQGVGFAYTLFLLAALAAGALAVGATAFAMAVEARRRATELAALRAVRVPSLSLRRSLALEQLLVLATGVVLGAAAGMAAAAVALGSVPEFVVLGPGPPLDLGLPGVTLAVALGALVVALGLTVGVGATLVVRSATVDRLGGSDR